MLPCGEEKNATKHKNRSHSRPGVQHREVVDAHYLQARCRRGTHDFSMAARRNIWRRGERCREAARNPRKRTVGIMCDLAGRKIRIGSFEKEKGHPQPRVRDSF